MRFRRVSIFCGLIFIVAVLLPAAAQAAPAFTTDFYPATVHASNTAGNETITTTGGTIQCDTAYHAELKEPSTTLSITPTYKNCVAFGFLGASVNFNGCKYLLHLYEQNAADKFAAGFDIVCEAGKSIEVAAGTCKIQIGAQAGLKSVSLINNTEATPAPDLTFQPNVTKLALNVVTDGFGCPFPGTGASTGSFHGDATFTAQSQGDPESKFGFDVG
jgi:hypothetical protein